jgi:hypothetical protein
MAMNNKPRKNWFQMQKERFGDDFLNRINVRDIDNNRLRILQDISKGNFDINTDMVYFCDQRIINSVIDYASRKTALFREMSEALNLSISANRQSANTAPVLNNVANVLFVYSKIWEMLDTFRMSVMNCGTYDITIFIQLQDIMNKYRDYLDLNRCL